MAFTFHFYTSKQIFIKKIPFSQTFYIISLWKTVAFTLADVHTNNHITCLRKLPNLLLFVPRRIHKQHILPSRLALISCTQKHAQNFKFKFHFLQWRKRSDKVFIWYWNCFLISILFNFFLFHIKSRIYKKMISSFILLRKLFLVNNKIFSKMTICQNFLKTMIMISTFLLFFFVKMQKTLDLCS